VAARSSQKEEEFVIDHSFIYFFFFKFFLWKREKKTNPKNQKKIEFYTFPLMIARTKILLKENLFRSVLRLIG